MTDEEKISRLANAAGVSREQAARALEASGGDMLEAVLLLEKLGVTDGGGETYDDSAPKEDYGAKSKGKSKSDFKVYNIDAGKFKEGMLSLGRLILRALEIGNTNTLDCSYKGVTRIRFPVTFVIVLFIFCFWFALPLLVVGMICGWRYSISGAGAGSGSINSALGKVGDVVDDIKKAAVEMDPHRKPAAAEPEADGEVPGVAEDE
ncbi:MAG: hypothetical protein LBS90_09125 [Oscillospiraceae bacterium]|jgi:hypothetical protein|nr:hypothetical protein [Oscillospiraceae bacterium]